MTHQGDFILSKVVYCCLEKGKKRIAPLENKPLPHIFLLSLFDGSYLYITCIRSRCTPHFVQFF